MLPSRRSASAAAPPRYVALIGDLVHSRTLEAGVRGRVQEALEAALQRVNGAGEPRGAGVAAELLLTLGDEFQGLFEASPAGAERLVEALEGALGAVVAAGGDAGSGGAPLRFGLGVGALHTERRPRALGMDGPCFHRAREALEAAQRSGEACRLVGPDGGAPHEAVWGLLASAWLEQVAGWTDAQREAAALAREGLAGKAIAERLGVTPGAVSQRLHNARYPFAERARGALARDLAGLVAERAEEEGA